MSDDMKRCPYCAEEILAAATKCKHCGSMVDASTSLPPKHPLGSQSAHTIEAPSSDTSKPWHHQKWFTALTWLVAIAAVGWALQNALRNVNTLFGSSTSLTVPVPAKVSETVKASMQQKFDSDQQFKEFHLKVIDVQVIIDTNSRFQGIARVTYEGSTHEVPIKITADANGVIWTTEPGAFTFVATKKLQDLEQSLAPQTTQTTSVEAQARTPIPCSDLKYGNEKYHERMDELATQAGLSNGYYSRYHEAVVANLCKGDQEGVNELIDSGFVKLSEVEAIKRVLVGSERPQTATISERSDIGKSYGYSREKFSDLGLCSACADNIAQYYTKKPESQCGKLAKQALEGNPEAISELQKFPSYCKWKY